MTAALLCVVLLVQQPVPLTQAQREQITEASQRAAVHAAAALDLVLSSGGQR